MLDSLHIQNFRCFEDLTIPSLGRVNLIVGKNSVGKSSLLEAIYIYSNRGRWNSIDDILLSRNEVFSTENTMRRQELFFNRQCSEDTVIKIGKTVNDRESLEIRCPSAPVETPSQFGASFPERFPSSVVHTSIQSEDDLSYLWDEASLNSEDQHIREALKIITPDIVNLIFVKSPDPERQDRIAIIKLANQTKGLPLKSFGEGISRLLQIFLHAFQARGGFLLIDEFENGLHYSIQEEVWGKLFRLATELNIQVFTTTHSKDAIESFCKVADAEKSIDGKLISLARSAKTSEKGKIFAVTLGEEELMRYVKSGMEVRG